MHLYNFPLKFKFKFQPIAVWLITSEILSCFYMKGCLGFKLDQLDVPQNCLKFETPRKIPGKKCISEKWVACKRLMTHEI